MSDYLPLEVWEEILHRLPLKSIVKCTFVCKAWKSLISDHDFIFNHLSRTLQANNGNGSLFIQLCAPIRDEWSKVYHRDKYYSLYIDNQRTRRLSNLKFPFTNPATHLNRHRTLVGTCNGLVCLADYLPFNSATVIICNPSIRKYVPLHVSKPIISDYRRPRFLFRFGYDSRNKDFKIVRLVTFWNDKETLPQVEVYSLATGSWRSITDRAPPFLLTEDTSQMFVKGAIHWVVMLKSNDLRYSILSFDVVEETFRELMLPHCLKESPSKVAILVVLDSLAICTCYSKSNETFLSIWVMEEYGVVESWTQICHFHSSCYGGILRPLALRSNGDMVLRRYNGEIILLDSMKGFVKHLGIGRHDDAFVGCYAEGLFLINKEQGVLSY